MIWTKPFITIFLLKVAWYSLYFFGSNQGLFEMWQMVIESYMMYNDNFYVMMNIPKSKDLIRTYLL